MLPDKLLRKLAMRELSGNRRELRVKGDLIDFSSNDYLGIARNNSSKLQAAGSTGSRLLTGNSTVHETVESFIATTHQVESALLYNSGYDANLGLIAAVCLRGDLILYDEKVHASIRDAISLSHARALKYKHDDINHLSILIKKFKEPEQEIYVITESVFSMDGTVPDLARIIELCQVHSAHCILDEAHALGVIGSPALGLAQKLRLQDYIFAIVVTYGKALGTHGAAVLGSFELQQYLINYSRPFIYSTAMAAGQAQHIKDNYSYLLENTALSQLLQDNISYFNSCVVSMGLRLRFRESVTPIQTLILSGNVNVINASAQLESQGYDVRAITSPTVPQGKERLRICLHSFNTPAQIKALLLSLQEIISSSEHL